MRFYKKAEGQAGFSLIEVLAAFTILSIVALAMTAFFTNALTYAKGNQNKTVMVNLARNALFYMEKQEFDPIKKYFVVDGKTEISCGATSCSEEVKKLVSNGDILFEVLHPTINGVAYQISIEYQKEIMTDLSLQGKTANYLIPINVLVEPIGGSNNAREVTRVEGYITNEKIR